MNSDTSAPPDLGRRIEIRYVCDLVTECRTSDSPAAIASVIDVSRTGVGLLVSQPLEQGSIIALNLPVGGGKVHACVVRVTAEAGGWWKLGCRFSEALSEAVLESLWKTVPDRRNRERFPADFHAIYHGEHCRGTATVTDISACGLCLLVNRPLDVGTGLSLRLLGDSVMDTSACVVRVSQKGASEWACGCSFVHELTDDQLAELTERAN